MNISSFSSIAHEFVDPACHLAALLQSFGRQREDSRLVRWSPRLAGGTGAGVRVALLDSGLDREHPGLRNARVIAEDFTGQGSLADGTGHGSQMAALLVGQGLGPSGGLAPEATLLFGKVLRASISAKTEDYIARGIRWAVQQRADILVLPLGRSRASRVIYQALQRAIAAGVQIFAAAGNGGPQRVLFPANLPGVVAVTGANLAGEILPECAAGETVDAIALGDVPAPWGMGPEARLVGSSPATVLAAAIAALELSLYRSSSPCL